MSAGVATHGLPILTKRCAMTRIRFFALVLPIALLPAAAYASFPPIPNATVPACFSLVGSNGVAASGTGTFNVFVRDLANNPMPGVSVRVDLSASPDLRLCAQQLASGVVVECVGNVAAGITDAHGIATFTLMGGSNGGPGVTPSNNSRVYADGILIGSPTVSAFDLDGSAGVGANDLSLFLSDFGSGNQYGRCDYDCSGFLGANDFSLLLTAFGSGTQTVSCAASCP
jgi:hypothetical protein